jgi:parallel beta-helix repeat protein
MCINKKGEIGAAIALFIAAIALSGIMLISGHSISKITGLAVSAMNSGQCDYNLSTCKTSGWEEGKTYCLNQSISTTSTCMQFTNNSVILDCQGYNITGDKSGVDSGIHISGYNNITVKNCGINNFYYGVHMSSASNNSLINSIIYNSSIYGVFLSNSDYNNLINNTVYNTTNGISMNSGSDNNLIINNTIFNLNIGIYIQASSYNRIDNNNISSSNSHGIHIQGAGCFLAGTKILLSDNTYKNIEDVKIGDKVVAYNEKNRELTTGRVKRTFYHEKTAGYLIINNKLRLTSNHPMHVNGEWREAGEIKSGDKLLDINGDEIPVTSIERVDEEVSVYNLEVSGYHNYFAEDVLTHNKCPRIFAYNGTDYEFDVLINALQDSKEQDELFKYQLKHLEKPKIRVDYDPDEVNYIDFIKLIVTDIPDKGKNKISVLNPILCEDCDFSLLMERDYNYLVLDENYTSFYLTFEELPELEQGYERQIEIFSSGYQIILKPNTDPPHVQEFLKEYIASTGKHNSFNNITNNIIANNGDGGVEAGIFLETETDLYIFNNTLTGNYNGMYIYSNSDNNAFVSNTITNSNLSGVYLTSDSNSNTFTNTRACFNNQSGYGAYYDINDLDANSFTNNTCDTANNAICSNPCDLPPTVTLVGPNDYYTDADGNITFSCNATDDFGLVNITLWTNITGTWLANKTNLITGTANSTSFNLTGINDGNYIWNCLAYDNRGNSAFAFSNRSFAEISVLPNTTEFDTSYGSTNFSAVPDITNVTNLTLATQSGKIQFPADYGVNADGEDYDANIEIGDNFISVNASALDSTFNASANLTINNVTCLASVYYGANTYTTAQQILNEANLCTAATDPACTILSCIGNTLIFNISHFTGFASTNTSNLTIWDETDSGMPYGSQTKYPYDTVKFFANYTNATGSPLQDSNCSINFSDSSAFMSYNTSGFYEYNRSFITTGTFGWNVTCSKTGFGTLTANDTVSITQFLIEGLWCGQCNFQCGGLAATADNDWNTYGCGGVGEARRNISIPANTVNANWTFKFDNTNASANHVRANCYNYTGNNWDNFYTPGSTGAFNVTAEIPSECLNSVLQVEVYLANKDSLYYEGQATFVVSMPPAPAGGGGRAAGPTECTIIWDCVWEECRPDGTQTGICTDIGTCRSGTKNETRFCRPLVTEYEVAPPPGEPPSIRTGKGIRSSGYFTTRSLQEEDLTVEFINTRDEPIENININVETPEESETSNVYITRVAAGGESTELSGIGTFSIMQSDLLEWNITSKHFDIVLPGEKISTNFSIKTPLTDYEQGNINLVISSDGIVLSNQSINISIDVPEFLVIPDIHEDEPDIVDIYMVMFNKEDEDKELNIEFNLNRESSLARTVVAEYYGPYPVKADDITIAAYRYKFSSNLIGSNYTLKAGLFEKGKKIAESGQILDLTKAPVLEAPFNLRLEIKEFILKNPAYFIIISAVVLLIIIASAYRRQRELIHRGIEHYRVRRKKAKERRAVIRKAKQARKQREIERRLKEHQERKRRIAAKRAAKIKAIRLKVKAENIRKAAELRKQKYRERKEAMLRAAEEAKQRRLELKRLKEKRAGERREIARTAAKIRAEKSEEKKERKIKAAKRAAKELKKRIRIRKQAAERAAELRAARSRQERKLQLKREEAGKIREEIRKIEKELKRKKK